MPGHMNKRGLSPVIATTMLILIALILAAIIFIWVRSFIGEKIEKDIGGGPAPIETFCEQVGFTADIYTDGNALKVDIQNDKDVPIHGVQVLQKSVGSLKIVGQVEFSEGALSGDTVADREITGEQNRIDEVVNDVNNGDTVEVVLVPILLGEGSDAKKLYTCDSKFGISATVA